MQSSKTGKQNNKNRDRVKQHWDGEKWASQFIESSKTVSSTEVISHYETFTISRRPNVYNVRYSKELEKLGIEVPPTWVSEWMFDTIFRPGKYSYRELPTSDVQLRADYFSIERLVRTLDREIKYKKMKLYEGKFDIKSWCKKRLKPLHEIEKMWPKPETIKSVVLKLKNGRDLVVK